MNQYPGSLPSSVEPERLALGCTPDDILVAVPTLNEADAIEPCLRSLIESEPFMQQVRVVVADGGSTDGTREIVAALGEAFSNLALLDNPARLQSAAVNAVVEHCATVGHRVLVRCDAHSVYPPGYVRAAAEALLARPDAASVVSAMDATGTATFQRAAAWIVDTPLGSGGSVHRGGRGAGWVDHGHHTAFRLDWFRRVGGYDSSFSHNEDAEYDHRLARAGGRIWFDGAIRLEYQMRASLAALWRQYWNYGRGRARTVLKHRMRPRLRQIVPALNFALLLLCLAVAPVLPWTLLFPAAYLLGLAAVSVAGAVRLRTVGGLWAGPALGAIHCGWGAGFVWSVLRSVTGAGRP